MGRVCMSGALPGSLHIEPEEDHVAVLDDVVPAFQAHLAGFLGALLAAAARRSRRRRWSRREMKPRSKSVWMTPAASGALAPRAHRPGARLLRPDGEEGDEAEQLDSRRG